MPKINSLEVVHQDTNKDSYDNLHDILVALKDAVGLIKEGKDYSVNKEIIDGKARAAYETLLEMYVNDKEAFARRLETLTAEFGTSIAKIIEEWTVYASATEAYAKKIEEVSAKAFQNEAKVTEEMYARVTADEAVAKLVTTLRADFENAQTRSKASIREEQIARANADEALASRSFVMEASIEDANARITEEQTVRATADEAIASNIESLTATVATNTASITTEQTVRATADTALATSINTLSATVGSKTRTYAQTTAPTGNSLVPLVTGDLWFDTDDNFKLYRYTGSAWTEVADARIAVNTTAVSTEQAARVTADSALAGQINTVVARLDTGDFAAVKTESSATASKVTGIEAKWGVTTNVNGYVSGIQLLNGGSSSWFVVDATKFIVKKPDGSNGIVWNGSNSRLDISGDVYADNFYGNVVNTGNIISNAVTVPTSNTELGVFTGNGAYQNINSIAITNSSSTTMPLIGIVSTRQGYLPGYSGGTFIYRVVNSLGTTVVDMGGMTATTDMATFQFYTIVPANTSLSYSVQWYSSTDKIEVGRSTITLLGVKR